MSPRCQTFHNRSLIIIFSLIRIFPSFWICDEIKDNEDALIDKKYFVLLLFLIKRNPKVIFDKFNYIAKLFITI